MVEQLLDGVLKPTSNGDHGRGEPKSSARSSSQTQSPDCHHGSEQSGRGHCDTLVTGETSHLAASTPQFLCSLYDELKSNGGSKTRPNLFRPPGLRVLDYRYPRSTRVLSVNLATTGFIRSVHTPCRAPACMSYICRTM